MGNYTAKKNRWKRRLLVLLCLAGCSLAGCGGAENKKESADASVTNPAGTGEKPEASKTASAKDIENPDPEYLPISLAFFGQSENLADVYQENEMVRQLERDCRVDLDLSVITWADADNTLERMFGSSEWKEVLILSEDTNYKGGVTQAVKDGVYWDLTDYIETCMPNYYALIQSNEEIRRLAYDDDNRVNGLLTIAYNIAGEKIEKSPAIGGMIIRKDWLEESGLDLPATYDDWEQVLTMFRDQYGCSQPLYIPGTGYSTVSPGFGSGMGALPAMQRNGDVVEYGPMTEGWKKYVTLLRDWYEKGLIGSEYIANDPLGIDTEACANEDTGAMLYYYARVGLLEETISKSADLCAVQCPVLENGQTAQGAENNKPAAKSVFITKAVSEEKLPMVLAFLDRLYDPDYVFDLYYGEEGDTYERSENNEIRFTDVIVADGEGASWDVMLETKLYPSRLMMLQDWSRELLCISEDELEMRETWGRDGTDLYLPDITLDAKEQSRCTSVMEAVEPYVRTMTNRMIVGAVDIDSAWDGYVQTIRSMGIEDALRAYQNAYNRYRHRVY